MSINLGGEINLKTISYGGGTTSEWGESKLLKSFTYTGSDQVYEIPEDGKYTFKVKGAGSNNAKGGYAEGTFTLNKGDKISVMVGQNGGSQSTATYGFGGSGNYGSDRAGGGLSGVFTGEGTITASDSARAMIIAGGAGGGKASGGAGGGETGGNGTKGSYGTAGGGGTQTGRNSGGNTGANQFNGGNGSGTYGSGGGGGWYGGNSSIGDTSSDDDSGSGGGSGYVLSTAEGRVLTQGGGADANSNGSIEMYQSVKVYKGNVKKVMLGEVQVWPEGEPEPTPGRYRYVFNDGTWSSAKLAQEGLASNTTVTFNTTQGAVVGGDYDIYKTMGAIGDNNGLYIKFVGGPNSTATGTFFGISTGTHAHTSGFGINISHKSSSNSQIRLAGSSIYTVPAGSTSAGTDETLIFDYNKNTGTLNITNKGTVYTYTLTSTQKSYAATLLNNDNLLISINPYNGYCKEREFYYYK